MTAANSGPATVGEHLMHTTTTIKKIGAAPAPDLSLRIVRDYLSEHGLALMNAAAILGGDAARGRVVLLIEALRSAHCLTGQHRRQLVDLRDLLMLENFGDPDRIETALFMDIDPDSPVVHELCRLADSVEALLRRIEPGACPDENRREADGPLMKVA